MPWYWVVACVLLAFLLALSALALYNKCTAGRCRCTARLDGKTVLVTGANAGIGKETAKDLAARGARVIMACRDLHKAEQVRGEIVASTGNGDVLVLHVDLLSLRSVRALAEAVLATESRLDVLVNNAGAIGLDSARSEEDGLALTMQANHLGHFLLTCLLLDLLKKTPSSRIVVVSSMAHKLGSFDVDNLNCEKRWPSRFMQYCYSKLCNVLMAQYLAEQLQGTGVTVNSLHPGAVKTEIIRVGTERIRTFASNGMGMFFKSAKMGAQTTIHLAVSEEGGRVTGKYFADVKQTGVGRVAGRAGLAEAVWRRSEELVKLAGSERPFRSRY